MATYKVIQDIEAEDKLVGPLTLRQFIYGAIAGICAYLSFVALAKGAALLLVIFVPPMLFTGFFAFPFGRDQPTEVWALAKIRFYLKSRKRLWDQSGVKDLVNITAPKKVEKTYTNGLSEHEVKSRLSALASTLDTRGWAVKNSAAFVRPGLGADGSTDRLLDISAMPQAIQPAEVGAADDMLDEVNNPRAQQLGQMVDASSRSHREQLISQLKQALSLSKTATPATAPPAPPSSQLPAPANYWFMNEPLESPKPANGNAVFTNAQVVTAGDASSRQTAAPAVDDAALADALRARHEKAQEVMTNQHLKTIEPLGAQAHQPATATPVATPPPAVTPPANPATINLAGNNDLNIATLARIANKQDKGTDEVVISLHNRG